MVYVQRMSSFICFNIFFMANSNILSNPIKTDNMNNPLDFYILFFSYVAKGKKNNELTIDQEIINPVKFDGKNYTYSPNFFYINSQTITYFYAEYNIFTITKNEIGIISGALERPVPYHFKYFGYIKEKSYNSVSTSIDSLCTVENNEIILYGTNEKNICFYYFIENNNYEVSFSYNINSISCKLLESDYYLCAYDQNNNLYLRTLIHSYGNNNKKELKYHSSEFHVSIIPFHDKIILYDTDVNHYKILCAFDKGNNQVSCIIIRCNPYNEGAGGGYNSVSSGSNNQANKYKTITTKNFDSLTTKFLINEDNCYIIGFYSEFLLCCGTTNNIHCQRKNISFIKINEFNINLHGQIKNLTMTNNIDYATLLYINETEDENYLYKYYIYPPTCHNYTKEITVSHEEEFLLFEKKTNTKYYIKFSDYPLDKCLSKLNGNEIKSIDERIEVDGENASFSFIPENNGIKAFNIVYNVEIEETYSATCTITLTIKLCYQSCKTCSQEGNEQNHSCTECKNDANYYHFPSGTDYKCYTEQEMAENYPNWYLEKNKKEFAQCNSTCKTCNGSTDENCLSCNDNNYLYSGKCYNECPKGTFKTENENGNKVCNDCYINCEKCTEGGNSSKMMCDSCPENSIIYKYNYNNKNYYNCYNISDNKEKRFFIPEKINEISSCFELYNQYIIENTNECIEFPEGGYFISNDTTGLLSKCHSSCLTCSKTYTELNSNCDSCNEGLLQDGNCVNNCSDGYYKNNSNCLKCHNNCQTCSTGVITDSNGKLNNMKCTRCKDIISSPNLLRYLESNKEVDIKPNLNILKFIKNEENCFPIIDYQNTTITFDISEIDSNHEIGSCFYYNKAIFQGEFECITKPYHTFYILNNDENTGVIKNCSKTCDSCILEETNCINCSTNYYKTEYSNNKCLFERDIPHNYYKNKTDNIYYECHSNCYNCTDGYNYTSDNMNCISCINNYYYIFEEENKNCYNMSLIEQGYYLDIYNISNEPIYKKCYENCKTCNNSYSEDGDMNCILCKDDYYKLNGTNNCYNKTSLNEGFYFKNNMFYHCNKNCLTCSEGKNEISNNCISCDNNKDLYLLEDLNNCENSNYTGYYLDNNINVLKRCYYSCKTCNGPLENNIEINEQNHNCIECAENYYKLPDNSFPNNCYDNETINLMLKKEYTTWNLQDNTGKVIDTTQNIIETTINKEQTTPNIILTTYNKEIITPNIIETIYNRDISSYNYIETTYNEWHTTNNNIATSYNEELPTTRIINTTNKVYITSNNIETTVNKVEDSTYNIEYTSQNTNIECFYSCDTCYGNPIIINESKDIINHNCIECKNEYYLMEKTKDCYNNNTIEESYYLDIKENPYIWKKCFERCGKCNKSGNSTNMNCLSCNNNLINNKTSKPYYFILNEKGNCIEGCENNLFLTLIGDCVSDCPNGTFKFSYNHKCLETCPHNYIIDKDKNACILKSIDLTTSVSEFKSQITSNITAFVNSSTVINGSDFIAVILTSDDMDPKEQLKKGISAIDLGNCTQDIKNYYNISNDESLIILNMESKRNDSKKDELNDDNSNSFDLGKNLQVEVYDMSGRKLDLSVCKEDIKIMKYLGDVEELDINSAMTLADSGIDVFNASDDYFNDICKNSGNNDKDIIIKDRRTDIYQNVSFCQKGCTYTGMDYELMTANCKCDSSIFGSDNNITDTKDSEEELSFKSLKETVFSNLFPFNTKVFSCYNLVFNLNQLKNNIGFYFMVIMLLIQIIFLFVYLVKKLKPLRYFMLIFRNKNPMDKKAFPPPKTNKSNNSKNEKNKENNDNANIKSNNYIMSKFAPNKGKIKKNLNNKKENNIIIDEESNNDTNKNSKRKLALMDDDNNLENILKNQKQYLLNLQQMISQSKANKEKNNNFPKKGNKKVIFTNNFSPIINIQTPLVNINSKKQESDTERTNINKRKENKDLVSQATSNSNKLYKIKSDRNLINQKERTTKNNISNKKNTKSLFNVETVGEKNKDKKTENKIEQEIIRLSRTDEDLQDMDYEQAIFIDKRTYLRMYWAFLVDTQIILSTFCTKNYLNLMVIKLSFFVFTFQINFFLNAFFYIDEYISDAYHNDGVLDFVSGLPKSIYSFIATLIITNLLKMLSNSKNELVRIIRNKRKANNYTYFINMKLQKLRKKLIAYFIIVFLLGILFLYYVSAFCSVYRYSQKYWFIGCLQSFGMDSLVAIFICIFLALFRYISIKFHLKCFYILANIISTFL